MIHYRCAKTAMHRVDSQFCNGLGLKIKHEIIIFIVHYLLWTVDCASRERRHCGNLGSGVLHGYFFSPYFGAQ